MTTHAALQSSRAALKGFLAAYHDRGIRYLVDPKTHKDALRTITEYVNKEQKTPTDATIMERIIDISGWYDLATVRQVMKRDAFRASLEEQVKFFSDIGQIKGAPSLDKAIVTDLL